MRRLPGWKAARSVAQAGPMSDQLRALGIELIEGYGADQLALKPDMFVVGNVVSRARLADGGARYPLMEAILNAGLPYTSGPQWLADHVLRGRHVLAVAGTHGKTTTTAMLAWILESAGMAPGFLVGGVPLNFDVSARLGGNSPSEENKSGSHFHQQGPQDRLCRTAGAAAPSGGSRLLGSDTNFAAMHASHPQGEPEARQIWDDLAAIERQFHHLLRTVPSEGRVIANAGEPALQRVLAQGCWSERILFGKDPLTEGLSVRGEPHDFEVLRDGQPAAQVRWGLSGVHNQLNALAALAAAEHVGVPLSQGAQALAGFHNVKRRMELRGVVPFTGAGGGGEVSVYDDFAHHPTAFRTTLDGLRRQLNSAGKTRDRILAIFEPRSNTMKLGSMTAQLPWSLEQADLAFCHAGGLDWNARDALAPMGQRAQVAGNVDELLAQVLAAVRPGDHLLCMSNGGFGGIHKRLLEALQRAPADA
ncbi:MAG: UDP-N-acetylmuramate:L-alanyl-gamma-D-glutamyl-meso-diaminopimelate ligase [Polaromonas sp. 24-62-144]|nr:MAG: UDP-N-acetylmuramate:L-alanyl-gamma-D-glutamyl-meso-diaminopimelate ligase [Polaromonas sp. 24-62-144]